MHRVGITGQAGFIGTHLYNSLKLFPSEFTAVPFTDELFMAQDKLDDFVAGCDTIVHLAAMNRHGDPQVIFDTNVALVQALIGSLERTGSRAHVLFSSSTQEVRGNPYGLSKQKGREMLHQWAARNGGGFTGLIIPNVFGPFGNPYYNSVIATFSHQLARNETPRIDVDAELRLIFVEELVRVILGRIRGYRNGEIDVACPVAETSRITVSAILELLNGFRDQYIGSGIIPAFGSSFERDLFNTFRCYIDPGHHFPVKYTLHTDNRGSFVELLKLNGGGQVSFSTTKPGITRGNHFHTRKIERFSVIKGEALIQLRRIGTERVLDFRLSGEQPAYVDMPVWHTHNITNTGHEDLYTVFWINEFYNPDDPDTFFEPV